MIKKFTFILLFIITILGCTGSKILHDPKNLTNIERTATEKIMEKSPKKTDTLLPKPKVDIEKREIQNKQEKKTDLNIKVEFNPEKSDSLKLNQIINGDSVIIDIKGTGSVKIDLNVKYSNIIFGSKTLGKIDSVVGKDKIPEIKTQKGIKEEEDILSMYIYISIGIPIILIVIIIIILRRRNERKRDN